MIKDMTSYIYDTLRDEILSLVLKPGDDMAENIICERFSSSRTPVRTAIQRLSDAGLVDIAPYQYTKVSLIDFSIAKQMIFLRSVVEAKILKALMKQADAFMIEDLEHIIRKQEILLSSNFEAPAFYALDTAFHSYFFSKTDNAYIWSMLQNNVHYTRLRMLDIVEVKDFISIVDEHKKMLAMIRQRDEKDAEGIITVHLEGGIRRIRERSNGCYSGYFKNYNKE